MKDWNKLQTEKLEQVSGGGLFGGPGDEPRFSTGDLVYLKVKVGNSSAFTKQPVPAVVIACTGVDKGLFFDSYVYTIQRRDNGETVTNVLQEDLSAR